MKKLWNGFKEFAMRGNAIDLAVGVIIGAAFKAIVDSLVKDIISPVLGLFTGQNFNDKVLQIGGVTLGYGAFLSSIINFIIIAFVLYLLVSASNKARDAVGKFKKTEKEVAAPTTKICPFCKSEIPIDAVRCAFCTSELEN